MKKRIISLLLCLCMVFSLLPTAVLAADGEDPDTSAGSGQVTQQDSENLGDQADPDNQADPDVLNDSEDSDDSDAPQLLDEGLGSALSGNCGATAADTVSWALTKNEDGRTYTLTISGVGAMADYYAQYVQRKDEFTGDIAPWRRALLSNPEADRKTDEVVPITEVKIGDGVTRIGSGAFAYTELTGTVTFSKNVTSYGDGVFARDTSITAVDWTNFKPTEKIRDGWATVYEEKHIAVPYAFFDGCSSLDTSIVDGITYSGQLVLPDTIEAIYVAAFRGTGFSTVDFSDGLSSIQAVGSYAITKLANMTEFTYPGNVAFYGTNDEGQNNVIQGGGIEKLTIAKEVTELPANFCTNTEKLTAIEFESGSQLTKIGKMAFYGTQALKSIDIPSTVTSIGESAFADCFSLEKIELGQIESLGQNTFARCSSLETAKIQGSPNVIYPSNMFGTWGTGHNAAPLKTLEIGAGEIQFDLSRQKDSIETIVLGDGVTAVPARFAVNCTKLTSVSLPDALTSVPAYAFNGCSSLAEVGISENSKLQSIGNGAFANSALTQIYIPKNVTSIGEGAFNRTPITVFDMSDVLADNMTVGLYAINNWYSKDEQANWPAWKDNFKYIYVSNSGAANSVKAKTSNCNYAFFVTNGGSVDATKTGFAAVYREGYTAQWFETENFTGSPVTGTPATGKTYYAKWIEHIPERPIIHYVLVQDFNYKGTGSTKWTFPADTATDPYTFNVSTGQDGDPKREGYKFLGWADESTATTAQYQAGDSIELTRKNPTKTIYAVWKEDEPQHEHDWEWKDNGNGTHTGNCKDPNCDATTDVNEPHVDRNNDGKCDKCGAEMPKPPTDVPGDPSKEVLANLKVTVQCETVSGHKQDYTLNDLAGCYQDGGTMQDGNGGYLRTITLTRSAVVTKFNGEDSSINGGEEHEDTAPNTITRWSLTWNAADKIWELSGDGEKTIVVKCNGTQPETPPTKPGVLEGGVTFECENADKAHAEHSSITYTIQPSDYGSISEVQYDAEKNQYYVLADVTLNSTYYLNLYNNWTGATHRISDGQSLTLTRIRFNYKKSDAPGGVASWTQELPTPVIKVTCAAELIPVELVIYRNGDTSKAYKTVRVAMVEKGKDIKTADYPIGNYYDGTNSGGKYDFYGWYDDGLWNIYKRDPANPPAGLTEKTVNGWTNFKCMVYDYEKVVYFQTKEALTDYQNDHSKTDGILFSTTARKGDTLPTADAPAATREGYTFKFWSREGQTSDVSQTEPNTVNGWTNLYANWEKIPEPTKENIEFNGRNKVYVKCDIYGTHAELIAYDQGEYDIVPTSDTTANLVFKSATYLEASKYADDHALADTKPDAVVSTQIVFKDGKWQQLKNGPTVQVRCKVTLTYDAHAPEGKPVTNMPDPLKVTQTLDEGSTTTFYLSEKIPACEGYVFLGWTSDTTLDVPTIPVEWKTENNGANWKTTTGYPGYTLYAVWQKITTPDVSEIDFTGKQIYVKCAIYEGAHGEFIDYIPDTYEIKWDGVSPKANLVFTAQSYLDASTFAGDHVLTNATQTEVSTQIVFENGQWTQKTNGPTVQVSCQAKLTYNANEPAGTASNMPDPNPVKQTLTDKETKTTVIALSDKTPSLKGYKFLGWADSDDKTAPDYPVENMSDPTKWSITVGAEGETLHAVWARTYSIYYDGNGGTFTKGGTDYTHVSDNDLTLGEPHTLRENVFTRDHYEFTGWAKTKEGPKDYDGGATDVTFAESDLNGKGQVKLYAQWKPVEVDVNVYIIPVDSGEEDSLLVKDVKLNAATLARIGLKAYETDEDEGDTLDRILVGKYASKYAATLTADIFDEDFTDDVKTAVTNELSGFQKDADIPDTFNTNNILSNTTWTWLSVEGEENFLSGNLPLYTVRFVTEDEANVKNMPTSQYTVDALNIYDFYTKGETIAAPAEDPTRTGYTFDGWYAPGATEKFNFATDTVTGDLVLTAKWVPEIYTITYEYNDKDINNKTHLQPKNPNSYTIEDAITLNNITAAGEHGKQFVEWRCDLNKDGVAETITEIPKGTTGNLIISAHWNYPVNYTVFDANGDKIDSLCKTEYVFEDVLRSEDGYKLTALTQDGYTFDGWYQDDADLGKTEKLIKDQTLRGAKKWELCGKLTPKEYTVTFNPNADDATVAPTSKLVTFDAAYDTLPTPTREGYTFEGWYLSKTEFTPANKVEATTIVKTPDDHTLYANWTPKTIKVTFDPNAEGVTVTPSEKYVTYDAPYGELPTPTREGYKFKGWHLGVNMIHEYDIVETAEDHTLLAGWARLYAALTINYVDKNGKKLAESYEASVALGADFSVTSPVVKGYKLRDKDDAVIEGTMTAEGYTYDVVYVKKSSGGSGVQIESPNKPKKDNSLKFNTAEHFAFVNGYPDGTVKPNGNVTRAEVAAILYRVMDADCVKTYETTRCSFSDVVRGDWFNLYVATLENAGVIVDTRTNGKFRPNEAITRAELAAMLAQFADIKSAANSFNDVSARHWASDEIAVCAKMGWINGYPDGSFRPDATITRAEMMAMINRALDRTPKSVSDLLSGMKTWSDNANTGAWYYLDVQEATNSHTYTKSGTHETWKKLR